MCMDVRACVCACVHACVRVCVRACVRVHTCFFLLSYYTVLHPIITVSHAYDIPSGQILER